MDTLMERLMDQRWALMTLQQCRRSNPVSLLNPYFKHKRVGFPYPLPHTPFSRCTYMYVLKSPVFCDTENGILHRIWEENGKTQNFTENTIFDAENVKIRKMQ